MTLLLLMLAQADPIGLGNGASFLGGVSVLGIMSWLLLVHLPNLNKRDDAKDAAFRAYIKEKDELIERITAKFESAMNAIIIHCQEEIATMKKITDDASLAANGVLCTAREAAEELIEKAKHTAIEMIQHQTQQSQIRQEGK